MFCGCQCGQLRVLPCHPSGCVRQPSGCGLSSMSASIGTSGRTPLQCTLKGIGGAGSRHDVEVISPVLTLSGNYTATLRMYSYIPTSVPTHARVTCTLSGRDMYLNPSSGQPGFAAEVQSYSSGAVIFGSVSRGSALGQVLAMFSAGSSVGTLRVAVSHKGVPLSGPNPVNVSVQSEPVSPTASSLSSSLAVLRLGRQTAAPLVVPAVPPRSRLKWPPKAPSLWPPPSRTCLWALSPSSGLP